MLRTPIDAANFARQYQSAAPFPHIVLDELFDPDSLDQVLAEIEADRVDPEIPGYGSVEKRRISDPSRFKPGTKALIDYLNGPEFIALVEEMSGIPNLIPDPHFEGGGIHQIGRGGFLKVHADFNWHKKLELYRRINVLLYLNRDWRDEWNGHLELWDQEMRTCHVRVAPVFNRMVIFTTDDQSLHGHPDPLLCPEGRTRNSIALYYYSVEKPEARISDLTDYRERPGENFTNVKHRIHQAMLKSPLLSRLTGHVARGRE